MGARMALLAPYAGGVLLVAVPWVLLNGLVFGSFTWSRTGDAWQQVYWGIYPPNRGWWPPILRFLPSSGWRASRGRGGRDGDRDARPGLPGSGGVAGAVHPLQALATEAHKLYRGYLHPFNTYAERSLLVGALAQPPHRALAFPTLGGWPGRRRWRAPSILLGTALLATGLPFLASHIDVATPCPRRRWG